MTRAELMRHALSQALRTVHIGPKKLKLDEETRWQIAGEAVEELRAGLGSRVATLGRDHPFLKPTAAIFLKFFQISDFLVFSKTSDNE